MKNFAKGLVLIAVGAVLGGLLVIGAIRYNPLFRTIVASTVEMKGPAVQAPPSDEDDFFNQADPFQQMQKMRSQMEKQMAAAAQAGGQSFTFSVGGNSNDIAEREDAGFVYYDIKIADLDATSINTKVENGYLTISGTIEKKTGDGSGGGNGFSAQTIFKSSFNRTFPLPEEVDAAKMEMTSEKDKVILKFPKVKS